MKYPLLLFISWSLVSCFLSCSKDSLESIPLEISFEDPVEALKRYTEAIERSSDGWEFGLTTTNETYFVGYLDFGEENEAQFTVSALAPGQVDLRPTEFRWRTQGSNALLSLPSGAYNQFIAGRTGMDSVFSFQAIRQDSIYLLGNRYGNQLILTPASLQKAQGYREGTIVHTLENIDKLARLPRYFKRLVVNGAEYDLHFRPDVQTLYIHYGGTERFKIHETLYAPTATGISLQKPLVDGINVISYLDALEVDLDAGTLSVVTDGISRAFTNEFSPSAYDMTATDAFNALVSGQANFSDGQGGSTVERFTRSFHGFTVAGVMDAYGLSSIVPNYQYMVLFHQFTGETYGGIMFVSNNQLNPLGGPALLKIYSSDRAFVGFVQVGSFTGESGDPAVAGAIAEMTTTLTDSNGFFVVSSGLGAFDLVSRNVTGGQKWIRFE